MNQYIKSPLNYIGGKGKLLKYILPHFPQKINNFVDLFAGGCNVSINIEANKYFINDIESSLINLYKEFKKLNLNYILNYIDAKILEYKLSKTNHEGFLNFRDYYNKNKHPLDLFVLVVYSFNYQIRFNSKELFNSGFGRNKSSFNDSIKKNLINFINKFNEMNIEFSSISFDKFDYSILDSDDFVYCDPPYLITNAEYNKQWNESHEIKLLNILDDLNSKNIKFALSNVIEHKGKTNLILKEWMKKYTVIDINSDYSNSFYSQTDKNLCKNNDVLIFNI